MLVPISQTIGIPVLSLQTGLPLARISEPIIDPRNLTIRAFRVVGARLSHAISVLHPEDIREINEMGVIVDDDDSLMALDDLVRLREIIDFHFELLGLKVVTENKQRLGRVASYGFDEISFSIEQLYLKPSLKNSLAQAGITIHRSQIVSIDNTQIVVKNATVKANAPVPQVSQSFVNPFRQRSQQPEG